jgi:hypothetical protein
MLMANPEEQKLLSNNGFSRIVKEKEKIIFTIKYYAALVR